MNRFDIRIGVNVTYKDSIYEVKRIIDMNWLIGEEEGTGKIERMRINDIVPTEIIKDEDLNSFKDVPVETLSDKQWAVANQRYSIIKPLLDSEKSSSLIEEVSKSAGKSVATIYRWIELYNRTQKVSSLVPGQKGGKGLTRLSPEIEEIIKSVIEDTHQTTQRKSIQRTCNEVITKCKRLKIEPPHPNTIRNRISQRSEYEHTKHRLGKREADLKYGPKTGHFPGLDYPLAIVQIDHTKLDIIVVDEQYRKPIGRPWITLAMDVYSRMVTGFYISMDPPGTLGTGLCIAHSILPKEEQLLRNDIGAEWPCWGIMEAIHLDNAKEFRGSSLERSCAEYGIDIQYRPPGKPEWGGHIERLLGTFLREIHHLPGTTFSNPKARKGYDSEAKATFSLSEIEKWLLVFIAEVYHKRVHTTLGTSPLKMYNDGILGNGTTHGIGIPQRIMDPIRLKLDFLPSLERTVQDYGVQIDHITYFHDVLRRWVNSTEPASGKARVKRKFIFKRDPRDISKIFFIDPELKEYFPIPYRDMTRPSMSLWEYNEIINELNKDKRKDINEDEIFIAYEKLKSYENEVVERTRSIKKTNLKAYKRNEARETRDTPNVENSPQISKKSLRIESKNYEPDEIDFDMPEPFDNIEF